MPLTESTLSKQPGTTTIPDELDTDAAWNNDDG